VQWAIHGDMPVSASPSWLRRLWLGALLLAVGQIALALIMPLRITPAPPSWISFALDVLAGVAVVGGFLLGTPQHDPAAPRHGQIYRRVLRLSCVALTILSLTPDEGFLPLIGADVPLAFIAARVQSVQVLTIWLVFTLSLVYLRRISARIPALGLQIPTWSLMGLMLLLVWLQSARLLAFVVDYRVAPWYWPMLMWSWFGVGLLSGTLTFFFTARLAKALRERRRRLGLELASGQAS
jgi:hypothetical protein